MRIAVLAIAFAGCGFSPATVDGRGSGSDASCPSFSSQVDTCTITIGTDIDLVLTGDSSYNTDDNTLNINGAAVPMPASIVVNATENIRLLVVRNFTQSGLLTVTGAFPFGVIAFGDARVDGEIDLDKGGAGARNDPDCLAAGTLGRAGANDSVPASNAGGGGGGGGAFGGNGGGGGMGGHDQGAPAGGPGGARSSAPPPPPGGRHGGPGGGRAPRGRGPHRARGG